LIGQAFLDGRMIEFGNGSIAIVGADAAALDEVARHLALAVDFSIWARDAAGPPSSMLNDACDQDTLPLEPGRR
jgi:hypothetical protein